MENWYRIQAALLAAIICAALAINVLLRSRRNPAFGRFAWLNLNLVALFLADALAQSETLTPRFEAGLLGVVAGLLPVTTVSFYAAFVAQETRTTRWATTLAVTLSATLLVFALVAADYHPNTRPVPSLGDLPLLVRIHKVLLAGSILLALGISVALMLRRYRSVEIRAERVRMQYLTFASAAVFSAALVAWVSDFSVAFFGNLLVAVYMFFMFQVITLRRILDLFEFLGRFTVLAGFAIVLSLIYALLVGWWRHDFGLFLFNTIIATVVVLILLDPLRNFVEEKLNELIFREKYEFTKQAESIRRSLANVIDVAALSDLLLSRLGGSRQVTHASIYIRDEDGLAFNRLGFVGTAPPPSLDAVVARPFLTRLVAQKVIPIENLEAERDELRERAAVEDHGQLEILDAIAHTMHELEAALTVAFVSDDQLLGFLSVKDERLREAYGTDEVKALVGLAAQVTITIENSRLFDRIRERDRLAAIGEMAAGLAHEIRNPLGAIKGSAQLLNEDEDQRAVYLNIINEEVRRLDGVVSQFLTYARPLKGKRDDVDVNQVLERTLTLVRADDHQSSVELVGAPNLPMIRSDPELIRQVILNLSRNAIEAMAPQSGGKLLISTTLTWRRPEDARSVVDEQLAFVRIRVEDEGPGIPPEVMERLFIPFYTTKDNGTGLGLAICQRIVKSLGGTIEVSSRARRGTTFAVYLPVSDAQTRTTVGS